MLKKAIKAAGFDCDSRKRRSNHEWLPEKGWLATHGAREEPLIMDFFHHIRLSLPGVFTQL